MDTVGDRIEDIGRRKLGKTGKSLAAALGVTYESLRKWKRGTSSPSAPRQAKIAVRLGVPVAAFMHGAVAGGGEPLTPDEARLLAAYRALLKDDRADLLRRAVARARELEELSAKLLTERAPLLAPSRKPREAA